MLSALTLLVLAAALFAQQQATVRGVSGRVELRPPGGEWTAATAGMSVSPGAAISTGFDWEATIQLGESTVVVRPLTRMRIDELAQREGTASSELFLRVGRVRAEVRTVEGLRQDFRVRSPLSTAAVRGTAFEFDGVNLHVDEGVVRLSNRFARATSVQKGEEAIVTPDAPPMDAQQIIERQVTSITSVGRLIPIIRPPAKTSVSIKWVRR
jgi:hypothetical protein